MAKFEPQASKKATGYRPKMKDESYEYVKDYEPKKIRWTGMLPKEVELLEDKAANWISNGHWIVRLDDFEKSVPSARQKEERRPKEMQSHVEEWKLDKRTGLKILCEFGEDRKPWFYVLLEGEDGKRSVVQAQYLDLFYLLFGDRINRLVRSGERVILVLDENGEVLSAVMPMRDGETTLPKVAAEWLEEYAS